MHTLEIVSAGTEQRRDRRYFPPALQVVIGDERYSVINLSMRGALLHGVCDFAGVRVRGEMGVPGSMEAVPFAATVIRADLDAGSSAICFEDYRTEGIEFHEHACTAPLQ